MIKSAFILVALLISGCGGGDNTSSPQASNSDNGSGKETPVVIPESEFYFVQKSAEANLDLTHSLNLSRQATIAEAFIGGVASGDVDNDGDLDLVVLGAQLSLFINDGQGKFTDRTSHFGLNGLQGTLAGLSFGDVDADGFIDLFVGGVSGQKPRLLQNKAGVRFVDITQQIGLDISKDNTYSASFADLDGDSDLDIVLSHWGATITDGVSTEHIWLNNLESGELSFTDHSLNFGLNEIYQDQVNGLDSSKLNVEKLSGDTSFTPLVADIDSDGDQDILMVSDFGGSKVLVQEQGQFINIADTNINDQSGMGSSLYDFDNDGDLDWFVTSIFRKKRDDHLPNFSLQWHGNKLYVNDGNGKFVDNAVAMGLENGGWAWATCFADFNHDGYMDIFQSNGWGVEDTTFSQYKNDNYKLYLGSSSGKYQEHAYKSKITSSKEEGETWQGRGVVCNDFDADGDIDIVVSRNQQSVQYFENQLKTDSGYIKVALRQSGLNRYALGSIVTIEYASGQRQSMYLAGNSSYASQSAPIAHFALPQGDDVKLIEIRWPDNTVETNTDFAVNAMNLIERRR